MIHTARKNYYQHQEETQRTVFYIVFLRELYRKTGAIFGSNETLKYLNPLFCQRFLIVTPLDGFLQGLTSNLLYSRPAGTWRSVAGGVTVAGPGLK